MRISGALLALSVVAWLGAGTGWTAEVPVPRPKPSAKAVTVATPIPTDSRGRLQVKLNTLGRERDPDEASELAPTTDTAWSKAQVAEARRRCAVVLAATNLDAVQIDPIGGPDGCGIAAPVKVKAFGAVAVKPAAKLNCTMAAALYKWVVDHLQPAARKNFKQPVVEIRNYAAYQCRSRRGVAGGRISEHSFGNALDIGAFKLANGSKMTILDDWSTTFSFFNFDKEAGFLKASRDGACKLFPTVLGPRTNKAHENHFHFDLGRAGRNKVCK